jgi:hemolysin activation/secretion protein
MAHRLSDFEAPASEADGARRSSLGVILGRYASKRTTFARRRVAIAVALLCGASPVAAQEAVPSTFDIAAFQIAGNTLLSADTVERAVYPYAGPGRSEADVEAARGALQKAFEDAGYVAVSVVVPE